MMVFDWAKAARLIAERKPKEASAGLEGDWEWTGGLIYADGAPVPQEETYVYLASTWATPELYLDGDVIDCFVMEPDTEWRSGTYWPPEALRILADQEQKKAAYDSRACEFGDCVPVEDLDQARAKIESLEYSLDGADQAREIIRNLLADGSCGPHGGGPWGDCVCAFCEGSRLLEGSK
jgi:hypothetical protein